MTHADLLALLLPPTSLDPNNAALSAELVAEGNALDLALGYADQLLLEADPRTASATLLDWERVYGLPESFITQAGITQSVAERRAALVAKDAMQGGQSRAFYISFAATLGYVITINEFTPFNTELDTEQGITDELWQFVWQVNSPSTTVRELTTSDDTEMATAVWGNTLLEGVINRYKPAHTYVIFAYS